MSNARLMGLVTRPLVVRYTKKGDPWMSLEILEKGPREKTGIYWKLVTFDKLIVDHLSTRYAEGMSLTVEATPKANPYTNKGGVLINGINWMVNKIIERVPDTTPMPHLEDEPYFEDEPQDGYDPNDSPF